MQLVQYILIVEVMLPALCLVQPAGYPPTVFLTMIFITAMKPENKPGFSSCHHF
jgi:hypothetical protein